MGMSVSHAKDECESERFRGEVNEIRVRRSVTEGLSIIAENSDFVSKSYFSVFYRKNDLIQGA